MGVAALFAAWALAQVSNNQSLTGKYYFRHVLLVTDGSTNVTDTRSAGGTLTFDGNGNFTVSAQQLVGTAAAVTLTVNGTYTVKPGGFVTMTNPQRAGSTVNARLGATALVGSSTEAGATVFDLLIAIPAATSTLSNATLSGGYTISSLEFPSGGLANIRNTNFKLTANGTGGFNESTVTGQAANLLNRLQNQTVGPNTYSVSGDATGTVNFPIASGSDATKQLIAGTKNIFVAQDGSFFIGGSTTAGIHGIVVGVKAFAAGGSNASWSGFFWTAGLRFDALPARLSAVAGAVNAGANGASVWARRIRQSDGLLDASLLIPYTLGADGAGTFNNIAGHVNVASGGQSFASSGVDTIDALSYELYFGAKFIPQSGTGVFLNPQGILNSASFAPPGYPLSPGGLMTLFGSGFGTQNGTAIGGQPFPTTLAGVQVTVNNIPAPLYSVSTNPAQISAVVPFGVTGSTATVVVTVGTTKSNAVEVPLAPTAPGIFSVTQNGLSDGAVLHANFTLVTAANPARRGETVLVFLTGLGAVTPSIADGAVAPVSPLRQTTGPLNVFVGGQQVTNVAFKGLAPTLAGLYQLNIVIPNSAPTGSVNLAIQTVEGFTDLVNIVVQ